MNGYEKRKLLYSKDRDEREGSGTTGSKHFIIR